MELPKDDDVEIEEKVDLGGSIEKLTENKVWGTLGYLDIPNQGKNYRRRYYGNRYQ